LYYSGLDLCDTLNGEGFRVSLFCSGCNKNPKCKYCQNCSAWDFKHGTEFTKETKDLIIGALSKPYISGLSLLGGEVTDNLEDGTIFDLLDTIKGRFPEKTIWAWTGYIMEELTTENHLKFFKYLDVLIDGEFDYTKKNLNNPWRNSENQRLIKFK
jgi:anaerobic ribonucleoside-triphosphate reductase activating protein